MGKTGIIWVGWEEKKVEARIRVLRVWIFIQRFLEFFFYCVVSEPRVA